MDECTYITATTELTLRKGASLRVYAVQKVHRSLGEVLSKTYTSHNKKHSAYGYFLKITSPMFV